MHWNSTLKVWLSTASERGCHAFAKHQCYHEGNKTISPKGLCSILPLYQCKEMVESGDPFDFHGLVSISGFFWCPAFIFQWLLWAQRDKGIHQLSTMCWCHSEQAVRDDARPCVNKTTTYWEGDEFFRCQKSDFQKAFPCNILHFGNFVVLNHTHLKWA